MSNDSIYEKTNLKNDLKVISGKSINIIILIFIGVTGLNAQLHPGLLLTKDGVQKIKENSNPALYQQQLDQAVKDFASILEEPMETPIPKDLGGGYTHETHKRNYGRMKTAGMLYQITGDEKYGQYVRDMLLKYVSLFPTFEKHPSTKSYSPGKLFWQCLNDANWLLYTSQAYDAIYDYLSVDERKKIEQDLLIPYADFISVGNPQFFNRIHNHSTWGNAAVGMTGLAIGNKELVQKALYGLDLKDGEDLAKDNDGGFIYEEGRATAGFLAQIDFAFSPDGYYEEGPYYQRYAMLPFMVFAQALNHQMPELKIFEYRGGLLVNAVKTLLAQTDSEGKFYPINDAQKGMSIEAGSVITAVDIAYANSGDKAFLLAAKLQNKVLLDQSGFEIAKALEETSIVGLQRPSIQLKDGKDGDKGALGILRWGGAEEEFNVVYKYTSQGLGHGHFDKLSYSVYDGPTEVLQDYGAARWVNIDQKGGGRYLPENKTWAKQTVAHNTLVVDGESHFKGKYDIAKSGFSTPVYFNITDKNLQIISAVDTMAYDGVQLERVVVLWKAPDFSKPIVIDVVRAISDKKHDFELPFHYAGQFLNADFNFQTNAAEVLGDDHGYQHVYQEASADINKGSYNFNWLKGEKFYSLIAKADPEDKLIFARIGANDPEFNLRRDAFLIQKKKQVLNPSFISVIESHGVYSRVTEVPIRPYSKIRSLKSIHEDNDYTIFEMKGDTEEIWHVCISHYDGDNDTKHKVKMANGSEISWTGPIIIELKSKN